MKNKEKTVAMKPFDERFADKVRSVFDHHQEAFDPGAWAMMQRRLSPKKKPVFVALWPYLSRAAVVLMLVGGMVWLFMTFIPGNDNMLAITLDGAPVSETAKEHTQAEAHRLADAPKASTKLPERQELADAPIASTALPAARRLADALIASKTLSKEPGLADASIDSTVLPTSDPKDMPVQEVASARTDDKGTDDMPKTHMPVNGLTELPMGVDPGQLAGGQASAPSQDRDKGIDIAAKDTYPDYVPEPPGSALAKAENKAFNWSVMAGSMLTYAEQQLAGGLGFSGGFISEWKVSPVVRISSGLVLAYQQFDVDEMPISQRMLKRDLLYAPENFSVQTLANHEYEMLAFDIPLNIHFQLAETHKSKWYVTTGVSSLLYLHQQFSGQETAFVEAKFTDQYAASRSLSYTSEVSVSASYDAFQRFDFARLLNLSFGYEIRGEKRATIIEPFIKYPLGAVSSREIKMGMGGVSLRYRFGN